MTRIPVMVVLVLLAIGLVDVILRCVAVGLSAGLMDAAHDPGKALFHVLLLPVAGYFLVLCWQGIDFRAVLAGATGKLLVLGSAVALVVGASAYGLGDLERGFFQRHVMPTEVADAALRSELQAFRDAAWSGINDARREGGRDVPALREQKFDEYQALLQEVGLRDDPSLARYWELSSARKKWSSFTSYVGVLVAASVLWTLLVLVRVEKPVDRTQRARVFIVFALLALWIPFRIYSEWHGNLGAMIGLYEGLIASLVLAFFIGLLLLVVGTPPKRVAVTSGGIATLSTVIGIVVSLKTDWFTRVAEAVSALSGTTLLAIYVILSMSVLAVVVYVSESESA